MNDLARIPYVPFPWVVIGLLIGVAAMGMHHLGGVIFLLLALGFAAKWACRWHYAQGGGTNGGSGPTIRPSCGPWGWGRRRDQPQSGSAEPPPSGNTAFDDYRREMLRRLEQDHQDFRAFLERLRQAKDKAEFDQFMADRDRRGPEQSPNPWPSA